MTNINYRFGYLRRKFLAPTRLHRSRDYIERVAASNSPDVCKTPQEMIAELLELIHTRHVLPFRDLLADYFKMGLHRRGTSPADYVFSNEYKEAVRPLMSQVPKDIIDLTDDKSRHSALFREHGFPTPVTLGILRLSARGELVVAQQDAGGEQVLLLDLLQEHRKLFCKPLNECAGKGCGLLEMTALAGVLMVSGREMELPSFIHEYKLAEGVQLLVQEVIAQHEVLASLHPSSLNTLRLWTIWDVDGPSWFQGVLRMGQGGSRVDNAGQGGIFAAIMPDGTLSSEGCTYSDFALTTFAAHPDTGVVFEGLKLPYFEEAKRMICQAHRLFPRELFDLAWDIAITPTGPVIVEVNSSGGTTIMQRVGGGWQEPLRERLLPAIKAGIAARER